MILFELMRVKVANQNSRDLKMTNVNRRQFNKWLGAGAVAIPASALVAQLPSHAEDLPLVDPESG